MTASAERLATALAERYRLERELGVGGMATVYLAGDLKHHRKVAIKVLHAELSAILGPERFLKEIELTANLQHPHILPLFDSGSADGLLYYVMPFVEGEALRRRLEREHQLPIADAVRIATEVADALDYAHSHGVVHRDIKPENILLQNGHALVSDFGIALAVEQAGGMRMTQTGLSLGTPQYMSPEQAMGERDIGPRSDIYSLGAVTHEMLAGEPPFTGPNAQAIVARVLTASPEPLSARRPTTPPPVDDAVATALQKLPADRFASAAEFARSLTAPVALAPVALAASAPRGTSRGTTRNVVDRSNRSRWMVASVALLALVVGGVGGYVLRRSVTPVPRDDLVLSALLPVGSERWDLEQRGSFAISPDGRSVAVVTDSTDDRGMLRIRPLDGRATTRLAGTEGASLPFWSPDGKSLGFFADRQLRIIDLGSGTVRSLCPALSPAGGSWGAHGTILYSPEDVAALHETSASGGECRALSFRGAGSAIPKTPYFLGDGEHFIATSPDRIWLGRLGDDSLTLLRESPSISVAVGAGADYVLFLTPEDVLDAQRIDLRSGRLVGESRRVAGRVATPHGHPAVSASLNGTLVMRSVDADTGRVTLVVDRGGANADSVITHESAWTFRSAHDGRRVALGGWGLWILDLARRVTTRVAAETDSTRQLALSPVWAPGDTMIGYDNSFKGSVAAVFDPRTGRARVLFESPRAGRTVSLSDWSPDGSRILFVLHPGAGGARSEPWVYEIPSRTSHPVFSEAGDVSQMRFSPNGRWLAYQSNAGGEDDIYLRPFPGPGTPVRVSSSGGRFPNWRADGHELYYMALNGAVLAVTMDDARSGAPSPPRTIIPPTLLGGRTVSGGMSATPDGQRFVFLLPPPASPGLTLMQGWWKRMAAE